MKLSSAKVSAPGRKQVWRRVEGEHADVLALRDEHGSPDAMPLLEPVMREGRRLVPATTPGAALVEARARFDSDLAQVPQKARRLTHPEHVIVPHSTALRELTERTRDEASARSRIAR